MIPYYVAIYEMSDIMTSEFDCLFVFVHYQYTIKSYASIFTGKHSYALRLTSRLHESDNVEGVNSEIPANVDLTIVFVLPYALPCYK